jgi:hypothetical protein
MQHSWKPSRSFFKNININAILGVALAIIAILGGAYGLALYIDSVVDKRLKDREVIEKLAKIIRPSVIFDSNEVILADLGATEYIESIKIVRYEDKEKKVPVSIEVKCKKFLHLAPLLTSIDQYTFIETVERGPRFMWIFTLKPLGYLTSDVPPYRFRLEVLQ